MGVFPSRSSRELVTSLGREFRPPEVRVVVEGGETGLLCPQPIRVLFRDRHVPLGAGALRADVANREIHDVLVQAAVLQDARHGLGLAEHEEHRLVREQRGDDLFGRLLAVDDVRAHVARHAAVRVDGSLGLAAEPDAHHHEAVADVRAVALAASGAAELRDGDGARHPRGERGAGLPSGLGKSQRAGSVPVLAHLALRSGVWHARKSGLGVFSFAGRGKNYVHEDEPLGLRGNVSTPGSEERLRKYTQYCRKRNPQLLARVLGAVSRRGWRAEARACLVLVGRVQPVLERVRLLVREDVAGRGDEARDFLHLRRLVVLAGVAFGPRLRLLPLTGGLLPRIAPLAGLVSGGVAGASLVHRLVDDAARAGGHLFRFPGDGGDDFDQPRVSGLEGQAIFVAEHTLAHAPDAALVRHGLAQHVRCRVGLRPVSARDAADRRAVMVAEGRRTPRGGLSEGHLRSVRELLSLLQDGDSWKMMARF